MPRDERLVHDSHHRGRGGVTRSEGASVDLAPRLLLALERLFEPLVDRTQAFRFLLLHRGEFCLHPRPGVHLTERDKHNSAERQGQHAEGKGGREPLVMPVLQDGGLVERHRHDERRFRAVIVRADKGGPAWFEGPSDDAGVLAALRRLQHGVGFCLLVD